MREGIPVGSLLSPQPWISFECAVLLIAGVLWIFWFSAQEWQPGRRRGMAGAFVLGAAAMAALALVAFYCKRPIPFWHSERGFGPFPNRNQTGDFFAVSGILALGCAAESFRERKQAAAWFGLAAVIIGAALVASYSRAAVALFFAGSLVWVISLGLVSRSVKLPAGAAAFLMVFGAAFLFFGGATLERFQNGGGITWGFRRLIARDVFAMIRSSPWCGIGLGNFEGVFAVFRNESAMPSRILHPESDWFWLWSEMGWPAVLALLAGALALFRRIAPLEHGTARRLRLAAAAAALVFAIHGLVDVSGHRLGSALPALFVLGMALNNPAPARKSLAPPLCFRIAAALLGIAGVVWLWAGVRGLELPGEIGVDAGEERAQQLVDEGKFTGAQDAATRALARGPLDWRLYFLRGMALANNGNWPRALDDFRRVNLLESTSPLVTFEEGKIWLGNEPSLAPPAWAETLRRCPPADAPQLYMQMLAYASDNPGLRRLLRGLASGRPGLKLVYLEHAPADDALEYINTVLLSDPSLRAFDAAQKTEFFRIWASDGGADDLARRLPGNPGWQPYAWRETSSRLAGEGDFKGACEWAFRFLPQPALPAKSSAGNAELRRRLAARADDYSAGYALYAALVDQKDGQAALDVLRSVTSQPGCPGYFHYLEASLAFHSGDFAAAWSALQKYGPFVNG